MLFLKILLFLCSRDPRGINVSNFYFAVLWIIYWVRLNHSYFIQCIYGTTLGFLLLIHSLKCIYWYLLLLWNVVTFELFCEIYLIRVCYSLLWWRKGCYTNNGVEKLFVTLYLIAYWHLIFNRHIFHLFFNPILQINLYLTKILTEMY